MWALKKLFDVPFLGKSEPGPEDTAVIEVETTTNEEEGKSRSKITKEGLTGRITILDQCMSSGVINHTYKFNTDDASPDLHRGMKVTFTAVWEVDSSFWVARDIKPDVTKEELEIRERSMHKTVVYKVLRIYPENVIVGPSGAPTAPINPDVTMEISKEVLPSEYPVQVGDWLRISLVVTDAEDAASASKATVVSVEFTEKKTKVGKITKQAGRYCVDHVIFFTNDIIEDFRHPKLDDKVRVISIASDQEVSTFSGRNGNVEYIFKKRAVSLSYENVIPRQSKHEGSTDDWVDNEPGVNPQEDQLNELVLNKRNVRVQPNRIISFQTKKIGTNPSKIITIENKSSDPIVLYRIQLAKVQDVAKFDLEFEEGPKDLEELLIRILPHCNYTITLKCQPLQLGRTKEFMIFDFGAFQIGRWLFIHSIEPEQDIVFPTLPERSMKQWKPTNDSSKAESLLIERNMRTISAPRRSAFFIPHRIESNSVPKKVAICYKDSDEEQLLKLYPSINDAELTPKNYVEKFRLCLWFEELENMVARKDYDLDDVILHPEKEGLYSIHVPRLKEFYPQLLVGDPVSIYESLECKVKYSATVISIYIHDDDVPRVQIRVHDKFNLTYDGGARKISFGLGRTAFKRMHFAIEQATDHLGMDWLFPSSLKLQEPRIHYIEDEKDNEHPPIVNSHAAQATNTNLDTTEKMPSTFNQRSRSLWKFQGDVVVPSSLNQVKLKWYNQSLNAEQRDAVRRVLKGQGRPLPYIIFGPPGTGKTVTVVEAIMQVYFLEPTSRILVTVPSNAAADLIAELLVSTKRFRPGDFVRLNGFLRSGMYQAESIADFCEDGEYLDAIAKNRLIICTVTTAGQFYQLSLNTGHFSHVFVDEAGYCTEPETMIPCVLAAIDRESQVILAGDPEQLGAVLMCDMKCNSILERSLLERLMKNQVYSRDVQAFPETKYNPAVLTKLVRSYRAHPMLLKLPSEMFYNDELVSHANKEVFELSENLSFLPKKGVPLIFHGVDGSCRQDIDSPSYYNTEEISQVVKYVKELLSSGIPCDDIGIITPYRKQVEKMRQALTYRLLENNLPKIASVQEFQGGERKIMIISTVRSMSDDIVARQVSRLDFLYSKKRFNVAVTRAKALMIIIGNPNVLSYNTYWRKMLEYSISLGVYTGCQLPKSLETRMTEILDTFKKLPDLTHGSEGSKTSDDEDAYGDNDPEIRCHY